MIQNLELVHNGLIDYRHNVSSFYRYNQKK